MEVVLVPGPEYGEAGYGHRRRRAPDAVRLGGPAINSLFINNGQAAALDDWDPKMGTYDWLPPIKKAVTRNGKMHAMPVNSGAQAFIYNTELYQKVGLDPAKPPTTFDQVLEYAAKVGASADQVWGHYVLTAPNSRPARTTSRPRSGRTAPRSVRGRDQGCVQHARSGSHAPVVQGSDREEGDAGQEDRRSPDAERLPDRRGRLDVCLSRRGGPCGRGQLQERVGPLPGRPEGAADAAWIRHDHGDGQGEESRRRLGVRQVHRPRSEQRRFLEHQLRPATAAPVVPRRSGLEGVRGEEPARCRPTSSRRSRPTCPTTGRAARRSGPSLARPSRPWSSARSRRSKRWRKRPRLARRSWTASARRPGLIRPRRDGYRKAIACLVTEVGVACRRISRCHSTRSFAVLRTSQDDDLTLDRDGSISRWRRR